MPKDKFSQRQMINNEEINLHKHWKIVKEIEVEKELERELEEILGKHLKNSLREDNDSYRARRRPVFRKNKK